jgi:large repetitive protein
LLSATGGGTTETYAYDSMSRVQSVTRTLGYGLTYTTSYQYNGISQVKQTTYPSGLIVSQSYDSKARLGSALAYPQGGSTVGASVSYNTIGHVSGTTLWNGVVENYGYDSNRLQLTSQTAVAGANTLMSLTYVYAATAGQNGAGTTAGNTGQLMSITGSINGQTESASYTYDNLGRLITSNQTTNGVNAQRRFQYDRFGNRQWVWDSLSGGNALQAIAYEGDSGVVTNRVAGVWTPTSFVSYSYDAAGNVTNDGSIPISMTLRTVL